MDAHILVVEDDDEIRNAIGIYLENQGYTVHKAENGAAGLAVLEHQQIHLAIVDIMMPVMDGYEATAAIRGLSNRPDALLIPIIAMTANAFAEDVQASLDAGMDGHLSKPIVIDEVVKAISGNISRK